MIGKLDRRVTFIQPIISTGDSNEDKITGWEEIDSLPDVWAQKLEKSGNTFVQNDRITFAQQTDWNIRFRSDLNVRMRLVYDTQVYEIVNIAELSTSAREKSNRASRERYTRLNTTLLDNIFFT